MTQPLEIVILAAGQGKRMHSRWPKVLQDLAGRTLLAHVLDTARALKPVAIHVVYGHGGEQVRAAFAAEPDLRWAHQAEQLGTGHALMQALPQVGERSNVLVLYGDVPLITPATLAPLVAAAARGALGLLTARLDDPAGYGRIVRDANGAVARIVEHKDATDAERALNEINTGFLAAGAGRLRGWLAHLRNDNAQGEYYLTDIISMAVSEGVAVATSAPAAEWEILGINSRTELARVERLHQANQAAELLAQGVTLRDPARFDLRGTLSCGRDVVIDVNVVIEGRVVLGDNVVIGPNNVIRDCEIGAGTLVHPNCVLENAIIGRDCRIGPFARVRPETRIADHAHVGNFVEIKKSEIGEGSKVNHLSYVGDSTIGAHVNIGAGTITCNYDGANKHRTVIGDNAFIGSNTALVAPITVGAGATVGAGSTLAKDAPAGQLTVARAKPVTVAGWKRPTKSEKSDKGKK